MKKGKLLAYGKRRKSLEPQKNLGQQDYQLPNYKDYKLSTSEFILHIVIGISIIFLVAKCFYDSYWAMVIFMPAIVFYFKEVKKVLGEQRRRNLRVQFKDAVLAVATNQRAGYSVENAFIEAYQDMKLLYGENSDICRELYFLQKRLANNVVLEKILIQFAQRSGVMDIQEFAEIFVIAKRSGGNLTQIIYSTAHTIEEKLEVDQEIQVILSAKKMEANIMCAIPFLIILYMDATSRGFFDCLYHNILGIAIMSVCLAIYCVAIIMARKIVNIEV